MMMMMMMMILKNPQKNEHTSHPKITAKSRIWGTETPEPIATKLCMPATVQDVITPANFCEDRLRGFGVARGRNFGLFHWLSSSPLKHSRTTVRVCDVFKWCMWHSIKFKHILELYLCRWIHLRCTLYGRCMWNSRPCCCRLLACDNHRCLRRTRRHL